MDVGTKVGAHRWPYHYNHPDCWGRPWSGTLLAGNDPRAWQDTIRFDGLPSQAEVDRHVAWCKARYTDWEQRVPVLWDFGENGQTIYWEDAARLLPYDEDVAAWLRARSAEYKELGISPFRIAA